MAKAFNEEISYMTLFPETEFNNITEVYTKYGAGAFLVELMKIVTDQDKIFPTWLSLMDRRPDIWELALTQRNLENEGPYLEKVNNLLIAYLNKDTDISWENLALGKNSFIPFNRNAASIQTYLQTYGSSLKEVSRHFLFQNSWLLAQIGLSETDREVLYKDNSSYIYFKSLPLTDDVQLVSQFKIITGLDEEGIYKLVYNGVPSLEGKENLKNLYINRNNPDNPLLYQNGKITNLDEKRLKLIQSFLILSNKLSWDFATLNTVLAKIDRPSDLIISIKHIIQLALISYLSEKWKINPAEIADSVKLVKEKMSSGGNVDLHKVAELHEILVALSPIANSLEIDANLLALELKPTPNGSDSFVHYLEVLYFLQLKREVLNKLGVKVQDYLYIKAIAKTDILNKEKFFEWYRATYSKLCATIDRYKQSANNTDPHLEQLVFNQFVHEFCVFTGLKELEVGHSLCGVFGLLNFDKDTNFSSINNYFFKSLYDAKGSTAFNGAQHLENEIIEKSVYFFNLLVPHILILQQFNLDGVSLCFLGNQNPITKDPIKPFNSEWADLYIQFAYLRAELKGDEAKQNFVHSISAQANALKDFGPIMGWPQKDLEEILKILDLKADTNSSKINSLYQLSHCFAVSQITSLDVVSLCKYVYSTTIADLSKVVFPPSVTNDHPKFSEYRNFYAQQLEKERDCLVSSALMNLNRKYSDINCPDHLSDYFLCDVEMSGSMDIAPLREATDAVQTYLMRCKNGLEQIDLSRLSSVTKEEWQWIPNFRNWQGEQMLRIFPENYLQPDVRSNASKLFKDTINDLQGTQLTTERADTALLNYLDEWVDLVNSDIIDASAYKTYSTYFEKDVETLFLVSKSKVKESTFYFTYKDTDLEKERSHWAEWEEIPTIINAKTVTSIYAFNRLHIFWTEQNSITDSVSVSDNKEEFTIYSLSIKCIYQNIDGSWSSPQTISTFPFYSTNWAKYNNDNYINGFKPEHEYWNKVGAIVVHDKRYTNTYIQLFCGPYLKNQTTPNGSANFSFQKNIESNLSQNLSFSAFYSFINKNWNRFSRDGNPGGHGFAINPIFLNQALIPVDIEFKGFDNRTNQDCYRGLNRYFSEENNNVYLSDYIEFITNNYDGTLGKNQFIRTNNNNWFTFDGKFPLFAKKGISITKCFAVRNKLGTFYLEFGHERGYLTSAKLESLDTNGQLKILDFTVIDDGIVMFSPYNSDFNPNYKLYNTQVERIFSASINQLRAEVQEKGAAYLKTLDQDKAIGKVTANFSNLGPADFIIRPNIDSDSQIDFSGAFGVYARELFFHIPMAIASFKSKNLRFDDAREWYHMVYNPVGVDKVNMNKAWKYVPFMNSLTPTSLISFDPDIIAENNVDVYKHWTILQYIDSILDFGDNEFRQETWESLSVATQLYFEVEDLLGQEPVVKDKLSYYETLPGYYPQIQNILNNNITNYFDIPANSRLRAHWDKVKDRLYKIRNGFNINGERQTPSMYGAAVDPARLLLAKQNGGINPYDASSLQAYRSVYRFRDLASHTESLINLVIEFGAQLHSALTQKDNEQLQALQATHQLNMLKVIEQTYNYQVDEANNEIKILNNNLKSAKHQKSYYDGLINKGNLTTETESIKKNDQAAVVQALGAELRGAAVFAHMIPTIFGFADGGFQPGSSVEASASTFTEAAQTLQILSQVQTVYAEHIRRAADWQFQADQAQYSIDQINANIESARIKVKIVSENLKQHELQISQASEVYDYLKNKFTDVDLYHWMSGQMASLYFTAYQLALGALHSVQKAYEYEQDDITNFIPSNSWNNLKKGLLAGETLKLALARLQDAYVTKNVRRQEIEKIISIKHKYPSSSSQIITNGQSFVISKDIIGLKNYNIVKIKSVSVSIPAVVGPYETFGASLSSGNESITISRGIDDMGIFIENINDGRYLPFEGLKIDDTGQSFTFTVDKDMASKISDVILNIKFTAK